MNVKQMIVTSRVAGQGRPLLPSQVLSPQVDDCKSAERDPPHAGLTIRLTWLERKEKQAVVIEPI